MKLKTGYGPLVSDTVLTMFEYVANNESNVRKVRQKEKIALAKERGIVLGRQEIATPEFKKAYNKWKNKEITAQEAAEMCGLQISTFYYRVRKMKG
jgi:DNA invertase Pin-like site-specific DNA recombinase